MPCHRLAAEAIVEAFQERLGQRDLGEQDEALPPLSDRLRHRLEIDLGLARSGDAIEQSRVEIMRPHIRHQRIRRRLLLR